MKKEKQQPKPKRRRVQFALVAQGAQKVYLVGDFNEWDEKSLPLKKDPDGTWKRTTLLAPGQYEYKFLVDGDWREDPFNPNRRRNRFGTFNCILEVA
jgi:1,4-alpha-glucan branching enzyme